YTCVPVVTERCVTVCTGDWAYEKIYIPGPITTQCCRLPGTCVFDPCTCTSHYCPGPVVTYKVQCPGQCVCRRYWVPRQEVRKVRCVHYITQEHCDVVNYTVCKQVPYTVMKQVPYTTCKMIPQEHCKIVNCRRCYLVPECKVCQIPYTTCHLIREDHCK